MSQTLMDIALVFGQSAEALLIVKATLLMVLGLGAVILARRARASVRSLALAATFGGLLALPLAGSLSPDITIAVPVTAPRPQAALTAPRAAPADLSSAQRVSRAEVAGRPFQLPPASAIGRWGWAFGATIVLAGLVVALWRVARLRQSALPWIDGTNRLRALAGPSDRARQVPVLLHEAIVAPFTCGIVRPVVVLPVDAPEWPDADLERALLHELEHVRRGDWATQIVARAACALYWFHPLAWTSYRRLCLEAERACDDAVLARADGVDYADQLVSLARRMSGATPVSPLLGMAQRSDLSTRVTALLDLSQARGRAGAGTIAAAMSVAAIAVLGIAPLAAVARPVETRESAAAAQDTQRERKTPQYLGRALYEAAEEGNVHVMEELIAAGADVNTTIKGDGSPLIAAARRGHLAAVRLLLDKGADADLGVRGDGNALIMAAREGHAEVIGLLLDRGASIDLVVPDDENALIQASGSGRMPAVKLLVNRGADINARVWVETAREPGKGEWRTPLGMARRAGYVEVADFLIAKGARE